MEGLRKLLLIANPVSGGGKAIVLAPKLLEMAFRLGYEAKLQFSTRPGEAIELASRGAGEGWDTIAALGGDGTVNEVGRGLMHTTVAMAIIPLGSGNGLARHCGIPLNPIAALRALGRMRLTRIDAGFANGAPFFVSCGIGFDAQIAHKFAESRKRGFATYAKLIVQEYRSFKTFQAEYTTTEESKDFKNAMIAAFGNAAQYGNNAWIAPGASLNDGKLNATVVPRLSTAQLLPFIINLYTQNLNRLPYVSTLLTVNARVECDQTLPIHIDGEPSGSDSELIVKVERSCLNLFHNVEFI